MQETYFVLWAEEQGRRVQKKKRPSSPSWYLLTLLMVKTKIYCSFPNNQHVDATSNNRHIVLGEIPLRFSAGISSESWFLYRYMRQCQIRVRLECRAKNKFLLNPYHQSPSLEEEDGVSESGNPSRLTLDGFPASLACRSARASVLGTPSRLSPSLSLSRTGMWRSSSQRDKTDRTARLSDD